MKARAYAYAEGGPPSTEIILGQLINRFGAQAVYGRTMSAGEIRRILMAEQIVSAYQERAQQSNWVAWCESNPKLALLLSEAMLSQ